LTRIDRIANTLRRTLFKPHLIHFGFTPAGTCRGITCFCFCFFLPRLGFYNLFLIPWFLCLCMWWLNLIQKSDPTRQQNNGYT
jgi:hypothetical protein